MWWPLTSEEWESLRRCVKDALTSLSYPAGSHIKAPVSHRVAMSCPPTWPRRSDSILQVTGHSLGGAVGASGPNWKRNGKSCESWDVPGIARVSDWSMAGVIAMVRPACSCEHL